MVCRNKHILSNYVIHKNLAPLAFLRLTLASEYYNTCTCNLVKKKKDIPL